MYFQSKKALEALDLNFFLINKRPCVPIILVNNISHNSKP